MDDDKSQLPDELELTPPGPELAALLQTIDRAELGSADLLRLARARNRMVAHQQAQLLADLHTIARSIPDRGRQPGRREPEGKYRWAELDVAFAMTWTATRAGGELEFADEVIDRLPQLFSALAAGQIDRPKAWLITQAVDSVDDQPARAIVDQVIEQAPRLTTGQLAARLRRLVIAADPTAARKRATTEVKQRRVQAFLNDNHLAALCGYELAPHRAAAAMERLTAIARAAKAAGDPRRLDQLRADAFLDLLVGDGIATGGPINDGDLPDMHTAASGADPPTAPDAGTPWPSAPHDPDQLTVEASSAPPAHTHTQPAAPPAAAAAPGGAGAGRAGADRGDADRTGADRGNADRTGADRGDAGRAGADRGDADRTGAGRAAAVPTVPAEPPAATEADTPADPQHDQLIDFWYAGFQQLPGRPPYPERGPAPGTPPGAMPAPRRGVIDLQVPLTTLIGLSHLPGDLQGWGPVVADIARQVAAEQPGATWRFSVYDRLGQLRHHGITRARPATPRRRPVAADAAFIRARDRTCRAPGCRRAARHCDLDHTVDWLYSNDSRRCNLACLCRRHHLFKHATGSELIQLAPGTLGWTTPAGMQYVTHPDTYPTGQEPPELDGRPPPGPDPADLLPPPGS